MKTIERWKAIAFVGSLLVIAFLVNAFIEAKYHGRRYESVSPMPQPARQFAPTAPVQQGYDLQANVRNQEVEANARRAQEAAENEARVRKAAQDAAEQHARFLARYLASTPGRAGSGRLIAIVAASDTGQADPKLAEAVRAHFQSPGVEIFPSLFTPEFVSDGLFNQVFDGSRDIIGKLELSGKVDALILAREKTENTTSSGLDNLITAVMHVDVAIVPIAQGIQSQTWSYSANGPGFRASDAHDAAEERILKTIAKDTTLTLKQ